jgi:hypothetical protein
MIPVMLPTHVTVNIAARGKLQVLSRQQQRINLVVQY